jgi:glycosyltransferase involved in cell wall biosynthesis
LKLIFSVEALAPSLTGIGRYTWELAQRLPFVEGIESTRFFRNGKWVENLQALMESSQSSDAPRKQRRGLATRLGLKAPPWLGKYALEKACRGRLFHGPNYFLPPCADTGVITVHDLSVFKFPETHPVERLRQFERDFTRSVSQATHLITDSEATRQEVMSFLAWPADKVTAVPLGVSEAFAPRAASAAIAQVQTFLQTHGLSHGAYTLCVSTLEPRKNIARLLEAYRFLPVELRKRFPLVVAGGRGWLSDALQQEMGRCAAEGWFQYLGFVPESELPLLFAGARLFVYPSAYEGFGLPVLEAMASGVPVVSSDRSSLPEVTQGAAKLVDPDDVESLSAAIEAGLSDEAWRAGAGAAGLAIAQTYSWDKCAQETVAVYRRASSAN